MFDSAQRGCAATRKARIHRRVAEIVEKILKRLCELSISPLALRKPSLLPATRRGSFFFGEIEQRVHSHLGCRFGQSRVLHDQSDSFIHVFLLDYLFPNQPLGGCHNETKQDTANYLQRCMTQYFTQIFIANGVPVKQFIEQHIDALCMDACLPAHTCRIVCDDHGNGNAEGEQRIIESII